MKTRITLLAFFCLSLYIKGQGTLQFNQARLLEGSQGTCPTCWTVPAGKVWKIGSVTCNSGNTIYYVVNNKLKPQLNPSDPYYQLQIKSAKMYDGEEQ
jgi:hypothetical protein